MSVRLATHHGAPVRLYAHCAGEIIAADGRRVEWADVPNLIVAYASQALQLMLWRGSAERLEREARDLFAAFEEAKAWRSVSMPTRKDVR